MTDQDALRYLESLIEDVLDIETQIALRQVAVCLRELEQPVRARNTIPRGPF